MSDDNDKTDYRLKAETGHFGAADEEKLKQQLLDKVELLRRAGISAEVIEPAEEQPPGVKAKRLAEMFKRYAAAERECPFTPGDLVTARKDSFHTGVGEPHIVLEVLKIAPVFAAGSSPGNPAYGFQPDIRIALVHGDMVWPYWVESWMFEKYIGEIAP